MKHTVKVSNETEYDVVVCGAGPSGLTAALAARRQRASVLLIEAQGQIGGMGTSGLVSHWLSGRTNDCQHWVIGGIFRELSCRAAEKGIALIPDLEPNDSLSPHGWMKQFKLTAGVPFDPFAMASFLDEVMDEAGVDVLFFTKAVDVVTSGNRIDAVIIHNKSGFTKVNAQYVIDATGDADIAVFSGCETILGREEDNLMMPVTLQMHVDNIDHKALADYQNSRTRGQEGYRFLDEIQDLMKEGEWPFLYNRLITVQLPDKDTFMVNTSRLVGYNGIDASSVSRAMAQGRKESLQLLAILRKHFPGFEHAHLKAVASALGVRETRRIIGDFMFTMQNLAAENEPDDVIGYVCGTWDVPDPHRPSHNPLDRGEQAGVTKTILPIPYRIMIPRPVTNLICPGRTVSVERPILGPYRDQGPCMAMGQAAGTAAAMALKSSCSFGDVDFSALRRTLVENNCIVDKAEILNNPVQSFTRRLDEQ